MKIISKVPSIESPVYFHPFTPLRLLNKKYKVKELKLTVKVLSIESPVYFYSFTPICLLNRNIQS